jgi:uncharacterized protein YdeI (YjbR/CyaY-like superfamily)
MDRIKSKGKSRFRYDAAASLEFRTRDIFRKWLQKNHETANGIWVVFQKGNRSFTAADALEEAICFGWIDGLMKSTDEKTYKKYFSKRKNTSKWSEKNIHIFMKLKGKGLLTQAGLLAFKGDVNNRKPNDRNEQNQRNMEVLSDALKMNTDALKLFEETSLSRKKQLAGFYCDAKTEETRKKRMQKIVEALKVHYKGMLF